MEKDVLLVFHLVPAFGAVFTGLVILFLPKGTSIHKKTGFLWSVLMIFTASTSFVVPVERLELFAGISALHLLAIATLIIIPVAYKAQKEGKAKLHARLMVSLYSLLCLTGLVAMFMPGRVLHGLFF